MDLTHEATEISPLLAEAPQHDLNNDSRSSLGKEVALLLRASAATSSGYLLQNALQLFSSIIISRLGALELSIAASGFMIATCTGWLLAVGGTTALDALGSKSLTSRPDDLSMIGTYYQRCLVVMTMLYIPVALVWCFIGPILRACGQPHEIAYGIQTFLRYLTPGGLGYIYYESSKKFLQCQNVTTPCTIILLVVSTIHVPVCGLVVHKFEFGLVGGVIVTGSMYWLACLLTMAYIAFVDGKQAWTSSLRRVFEDLLPFAKLVGLGIMMVGAEWWAFELIAIAAGTMGKIPIAAQSILMTVDSIFALIPFGMGTAATNRVGNHIGARQYGNARIAARAASCIGFANGCVTMIIIMTCRRYISRFFTHEREVVDLAVEVFPWGAAFQVFDSLQAVNSGCLRAMGRADIGAKVNLTAYYVFAIPVGLGTGFYLHWGLHGLWFGLAGALAIVGTGECLIVNVVPWRMYVHYEEAKALQSAP